MHLPHDYQQVDEAGIDGERGSSTTTKQNLSLYNLVVDPAESNDLSRQFPNIVDELLDLARTFDSKLQENKRPAGKSEDRVGINKK